MCMCTLLRLYIIGIFSCWEWEWSRCSIFTMIGSLWCLFLGDPIFEITDWFQLCVGLHPVRLDYMP